MKAHALYWLIRLMDRLDRFAFAQRIRHDAGWRLFELNPALSEKSDGEVND